MANGTEAAVTQAARLPEIGFPEFTAKLITDTYDAIVAANIRQTESYMELLQQVAKVLTAYINDTRDDIGGEQILQFLANILDDPASVAAENTLSAAEAEALNKALDLTGQGEWTAGDSTNDGAGNDLEDNKIPDATITGQLDQPAVEAIFTAVANRIAANKYDT